MSSISTIAKPYIVPDNLPVLPSYTEVPVKFRHDDTEGTMTGTPRTSNYTMHGTVDDGHDATDEKNVSVYIRRERPSDKVTGDHGAIVLPIIKDSTGSLKTVLSVVPRGGTYRITLELPAFMTWSDTGVKGDLKKTFDQDSLATKLRALRMKTGLGTDCSLEQGFSMPKILHDFGTMAIHPGTENTRKTLTAFAVDFSGELHLDGSNLPTKSEESSGEIVKRGSTPDRWDRGTLVVPLDQLLSCVSAFKGQQDRDVDVSLGAMAPFLELLSRSGGLSTWYDEAKPLQDSEGATTVGTAEA